MHDGKALQAGTSHYFGTDLPVRLILRSATEKIKNPIRIKLRGVFPPRLIGGIIMTHGDDNGLALPPAVAPIQAVIIPHCRA